MIVGTNGIIVDSRGRVLLIRRDDTLSWALPGGSLEAGELPTDGIAREVEEETGLKVVAVRLVGLYFGRLRGDEFLIFTFRCLQRGGEISPSDESSHVGFARADALPRPFFSLHEEELSRGVSHPGGPPHWDRQRPSLGLSFTLATLTRVIHLWKNMGRRWRGQPRFRREHSWHLSTSLIISGESGGVLWKKPAGEEFWRLPGGRCRQGEAPWEAAARQALEKTATIVRLTDLAQVTLGPDENELHLTFMAEVAASPATGGSQSPASPPTPSLHAFPPGDEPPGCDPEDVKLVSAALKPRNSVHFE